MQTSKYIGGYFYMKHDLLDGVFYMLILPVALVL
jgi:hypothetical protein